MKAIIEILVQAKDKQGNMHDVKAIEMGGYRTYVEFYEKGLPTNSVDYEFYINGRKINIYSSALFNHYMEANHNNLIETIVEERKPQGKDDLPF